MFEIKLFFMFFLNFGGFGFNWILLFSIKSNISKDFGDVLRKGRVFICLFVNSLNFFVGIYVEML